jgi:hypothetical protein
MPVTKYVQGYADSRIVHAEAADGDDRTLCGDALEGDFDNKFGALLPTDGGAGQINCELCVRIITYCKSVRANEIAPAKFHMRRDR